MIPHWLMCMGLVDFLQGPPKANPCRILNVGNGSALISRPVVITIRKASYSMLKPTNYLDQSYSEATLADHRDFQLLLNKERSVWSRSVRSFLNLECDQIVTHQTDLPVYELPNVHRAIKALLSDWKLIATIGVTSGDYRDLPNPVYQHFTVRPNRRLTFLCQGTQFYQLPDGQRCIVSLDKGGKNELMVSLQLIGPADQHRGLVQIERRLVRWIRQHHYLRRQAIRADGTLLSSSRPITWNDVALPTATKGLLQKNTVDLLKLGHLFRNSRIPQRRGILLYGPPGTGKTLIGKLLASLKLATFIWVTAADVGCDPQGVRRVFRLARKLRPTILFFEDLDFFAADRGRQGRNTVLGELLTQMDGLERSDGLIVVATTNDLEAIEPALKDRPSRFDVVIPIGLPDVAARRQILQQRLSHLNLPSEVVDTAAESTNGLSGAQIQEVAILTAQAAIFRNAVDAEGKACPTAADVNAAVAQFTGKERRKVGFGVSCQATP